MKAILTAAWAAVLFLTSLPASANQPEWDTRRVQVNYSDLDLTGARGVSTLQHRVTGAIHQVCGGPAFESHDEMQQRACERAAGTAASRDVEDAIAASRQLASPRSVGTAAAGALKKTISSSSQPRANALNPLPRR